MSCQLLLEVVQSHRLLPLTHSVVEQSAGEIVQFILVKVHPILPHTGLNHLPEVPLLQDSVLVYVVDLEEKLDLCVIISGAELSHSLDKLCLCDVSTPVAVKYLEYSLNKKFVLARHNLLELLQADVVLIHPEMLLEHSLQPLSGVHTDLGASGRWHDEAHEVVHTNLAGSLRAQDANHLSCHSARGEYFVKMFRSYIVILTNKIRYRLDKINEIQPILSLLCFFADICLKRKVII